MAGLMALMGGQRQSRLRKRDSDAAAPMQSPVKSGSFPTGTGHKEREKDKNPASGNTAGGWPKTSLVGDGLCLTLKQPCNTSEGTHGRRETEEVERHQGTAGLPSRT